MKVFAGLASSLMLMMTLIFLYEPFANKEEELREARDAIATALQETQARLSRTTTQIQNDPTFIENLAGGLENSAHQFLDGNLQAGSVDSIRIYNDRCDQLIAVMADQGGTKSCSPQDTSKARTTWTLNAGIPILQNSVPLADSQGHRFILTTQVNLGSKWLASRTTLTKYWRSLDLNIGAFSSDTKRAVVVQPAGQTSDGIAITVYSQNWMMVYLWNYLHLTVNALRSLILMFGLIAGAFTYTAFSRYRALSQQVNRDIESVGTWVNSLALNPFSRPNPNLVNYRPLKVILIELGQHFQSLEALNRDHLNQTRQLQEEILTQKSLVRLKDVEINEYQEFKSLAAQLQHTTDGFINNMNELNDMFENLSDILTHGMKKHTQTLCQFTSNWQKNLRETSARKFFRTLAERVFEEGDNELSRELEKLFSVSHQIGTQSINLALQTQKIRQRLEKATQHAEHWQSLSLKGTDAKTGGRLLDLVEEGENLLKMVPGLPTVRFRHLFEESLAVDGIPVPKAVWSSSFYHLQLALVEIARASSLDTVEIQTRVRHRKRQNLLVFSLAVDPTMTVNTIWPLPEAAQDQIDLANALLHPHKVRVTPLPTVKDLPPLAVVWDSRSDEAGRGMEPELTL